MDKGEYVVYEPKEATDQFLDGSGRGYVLFTSSDQTFEAKVGSTTGSVFGAYTNGPTTFSFYYNAAEDASSWLKVTTTGQLSGVEDVMIDNGISVEYYNLNGVKVENPAPGIYIRRCGTQVSKVVVR